MAARIVQITDLHLMADPSAELKGVCTRATLQAVLDVLRRDFSSSERLIVTGDLAHDELRETYEALRDLLAEWMPKLRLIPGNHENRDFMRQVFGDRVTVVDDRNVFADSVGGWRLIGLDSQLPGEVRGQLGESQRDWLARELAAEPLRPTVVFLHHPPLKVGTGWLDEIWLEDADPFLDLLSQHRQVKFVCCGHIHHEMTVVQANTLMLTTPATSVQFLPDTDRLIPDSVPPGFRIFDLEPDGSFRTRVVRVPIVTGDLRRSLHPSRPDAHRSDWSRRDHRS
ncbi:3',5'-cyclic adenosine monophosphate phosphodiesterase CpdA [Planctomycetia bacterium]|nr:3',5'-cyclic adenosine monophosphate phosphodiesterase CpdA [Planctomycetia bacterium]